MQKNKVSAEELRTVFVLENLPDEHLHWILERGEYVEFEDGATIIKTGEEINNMWFILEGTVTFYMDMNGRLVHFYDFGNDAATGGASGLLPYSRMKGSPGYSYAKGKLRAFQLHKDHFPELEKLNPALIQLLIGFMTERARAFATVQLQQEKVNALGNLAAGIAHELNNPATAINRISSELKDRLMLNYSLTQSLIQHQINPQMLKSAEDLVKNKLATMKPGAPLKVFEKMELEEILEQWLCEKRVNEPRKMSESFAESGFSIADLETLCGPMGAPQISPFLAWIENLVSSEKILSDLNLASCRISNLVGAIKSHVHMDKTQEFQKTKIHSDLENSITLLGFKIREKQIKISRKYMPEMPEVEAMVGELNQVWTNLLDNAIFAVPQGGEICIETQFDANQVCIKIVDNGPGIPPEIINRIFDPFFTTKKVGQGTGIGLDLVNRIIKKHGGLTKVFSKPGRTEFLVQLPIHQFIPSKKT